MASLCVFLVLFSCITAVDAFRSRQRKVEMPWSDFDGESKGLVHVDEFSSKLLPRIEQLGVDDVSETLERVSTSIDLDGDGFVSKSEYHAGLALLEKTVQEQNTGKGERGGRGHAPTRRPDLAWNKVATSGWCQDDFYMGESRQTSATNCQQFCMAREGCNFASYNERGYGWCMVYSQCDLHNMHGEDNNDYHNYDTYEKQASAFVKLTSGHCRANQQISKAECLAAAQAVGASASKTTLDGGSDQGLNGRPQGCTLHIRGSVEWWGASDNAACGSLSYNCVCKAATPATPLPTPQPTPTPTPRPTPAPTEAPTEAPLTLAPTPSGTIKKVIFGGSRGQSLYGDNVWKRRPEWAKYERCSMTHCEECDGDVSCWHAASGGYMSNVETTAAAPSNFVNYTLVVHAKCETSADTRFSVTTWLPEGGTLKAFWDMELVKTIAAGTEKAWWSTALNGESAKEFRLTWIPTQLESSCTLQVDVAEVSAGFTQCQDQQVCLEKLGSGSNLEEGLRLREENHLLKECLDGDTGSFSDALEDKCEEWLGCIDQTEGMREHLSTALVAAKVTTTVEYGAVPDDPSCVNPAISDVFSWECDCYEVAEIKCKENYQHMHLDECLNMMLCCSDKVCNSWKRTTGCNPDWCAASGSLLENRLNESEVLRGNDDDITQALLEHSSSQVQLKDGVEDLDNALGSKACI